MSMNKKYLILIKRGKEGGYYCADQHWLPVGKDDATLVGEERAHEITRQLKHLGYYPEIVEADLVTS